jgi:hypothetical protein
MMEQIRKSKEIELYSKRKDSIDDIHKEMLSNLQKNIQKQKVLKVGKGVNFSTRMDNIVNEVSKTRRKLIISTQIEEIDRRKKESLDNRNTLNQSRKVKRQSLSRNSDILSR